MSEFIKHVACPCGTSVETPAFAFYEDGSYHCFSCDGDSIPKEWKANYAAVCKRIGKEKVMKEFTPEEAVELKKEQLEELELTGVGQGSADDNKKLSKEENKERLKEEWKTAQVNALPGRKLKLKTCEKYGVRSVNGTYAVDHFYPFFSSDNKLIAYKKRIQLEDKKTYTTAGRIQEAMLFGCNAFSKGGKYIIITEGEIDALSAYQILEDSKYTFRGAVVSLKNGSNSVKKSFADKNIYEYVNSFDNIVICFDNDDAGNKAKEQLLKLFDFGKIKIMKLSKYKDANEYLVAGAEKDFISAFWGAEEYSPEDIVCPSDPEYKREFFSEEEAVCYPYPWKGLEKITYGARLGEIITIIAQTGIGKTQLLKELEVHFRDTTDFKIGIIHLEEIHSNTTRGLLGIKVNAPIHLPKHGVSLAIQEKAYDELYPIDNKQIHIYKRFGSANIDTILDKIQFLVKGRGCKFLFLDHISIITSDQRNEDERKALDEIITKLKMKAIEWGFNLHMIAHLNRNGEIRGTANIEKLSDIILELKRDHENDNEIIRNSTKIICKKNRFSGLTGPAGWLYFNPKTNRMTETASPHDVDELAKEFE